MSLPNGLYKTTHGSTMELSGNSGGISKVVFDWPEEPNACCDCRVDVYPENWGDGEYRMTWNCEVCGGGSATLIPTASGLEERK